MLRWEVGEAGFGRNLGSVTRRAIHLFIKRCWKAVAQESVEYTPQHLAHLRFGDQFRGQLRFQHESRAKNAEILARRTRAYPEQLDQNRLSTVADALAGLGDLGPDLWIASDVELHLQAMKAQDFRLERST